MSIAIDLLKILSSSCIIVFSILTIRETNKSKKALEEIRKSDKRLKV